MNSSAIVLGGRDLIPKIKSKNILILSSVDNRLIEKYYSTCSYFSASKFETFSISIAQSVRSPNCTFATNSGGPYSYLNNNLIFSLERKNYFSYVNNIIYHKIRKHFLDHDFKTVLLDYNINLVSDVMSLGELEVFRKDVSLELEPFQ